MTTLDPFVRAKEVFDQTRDYLPYELFGVARVLLVGGTDPSMEK
jgi:hypothetical protein